MHNYPFNDVNEELLRSVWEKGFIVPGYDPQIYRKDICGWWIKFDEHGNTNSDYGWEIDHIKPKTLNGSDKIQNLQPLNWRINRYKGDIYPWDCSKIE